MKPTQPRHKVPLLYYTRYYTLSTVHHTVGIRGPQCSAVRVCADQVCYCLQVEWRRGSTAVTHHSTSGRCSPCCQHSLDPLSFRWPRQLVRSSDWLRRLLLVKWAEDPNCVPIQEDTPQPSLMASCIPRLFTMHRC